MSLRLKIMSLVCIAISFIVGVSNAHARDYGKVGTTFPIIEADLLTSIQSKLQHLEATGAIEASNKKMVAHAKRKVMHPDAVRGIAIAGDKRSWVYDPSIVVSKAIMDTKGNVIAPAGKKVNPLAFVSLTEDLVFISGSDQAQVDWAMKKYTKKQAKIIFVDGSPFQQMGKKKRRFYFDQGGFLTAKFGVTHTPTVGSQEGMVIRFQQFPLDQKGRES